MPGVIDDARHTLKNATVKNFTSTKFLRPIKFDSSNGGTSNSRIKKNVNSPFKDIAGIIVQYVLIAFIIVKLSENDCQLSDFFQCLSP